MGDTCSDATQGILAYNNVDLISNGYINAVDTDRKGRQVQLLPSDRMSIEFQYSVRSDVTGTSLNSLSPGGNAGFLLGGLAGGAGFILGSALGCSLLGDMEPTISRFVFHVCKAETKINSRITVTQAMIDEARLNRGVATYKFSSEYPMGILGVTASAIRLTDEEIEQIGSGSGNRRGHTITNQGLIQARFSSYDSSSADNLFIEIVRDPRKFLYRADNNIPGDSSSGLNAFLNGSSDDLTDRKIKIQLISAAELSKTKPILPKVGDTLFITYESCTERPIRQAVFVSSLFFLFPAFEVERIGVDKVKAWNFIPMKFKARKDLTKKANITDLIHDQSVLGNPQLTAAQVNAQTRLETIEAQRLIEVINDTATNKPYISGFYFADSRGILMYDVKDFTKPPVLLIAASQIRDQTWWKDFIASFIDGGPGFNSQGVLDVTSDGAARLLRGFVFDISDHVNSVCYDNDKFGYQRDLAAALRNVTPYDPSIPTSGIGISNLDLFSLGLPHNANYDLSSAKFFTYSMSSIEGGAYFVRDCNKTFTYDQAFCTFGTLQADMFVRTPFFFDSFPTKSHVYLERFTPQFSMAPDGGIWVATSPVAGNGISADCTPYKDSAILVFNQNGVLRYHKFTDALLHMQIGFAPEQVSTTLLDHTAPSLDTVTESNLNLIGYDQIFGNQPSYSKGIEITTETGRIDLGFLNASIYKKFNAVFMQNKNKASASITGITGKRIKTINLTYTPDSSDFPNKKKRSLAFIFPKNNQTIDNVVLSYTGGSTRGERSISFSGGYYTDDTINIIGDILKYITIKKIEIVYLTEEAYQQHYVSAANSSVVLDGSGRIYVFYEDTQNPAVPAPNEAGGPGFSASNATEISCLISNDGGNTWYDHKAVVRTIGTETVRTPVAVCDKKNNIIHLMYVHNDCLMHKAIDASLFRVEDAFWNYSRPLSYLQNFPDGYGLSRFSAAGYQLRTLESNVVIGNLDKGSFLDSQLSIDRARLARHRSRFTVWGDRKSFKDGFTETSYVVLRDRKSTLKVFYLDKGRIQIRASDSYGRGWMDVAPEGIAFHKNVSIFDPQTITSLGHAFDEKSNILHLTYVVDGMMFLKSFDLSSFEPNNEEISKISDADNPSYAPTFVVGAITTEVSNALRARNTNIRYRYPTGSMGVFNQKMSISDVGTTGFVGSRGLARFFYIDGEGDIRAFLLPNTRGAPSLDSKRKVGG